VIKAFEIRFGGDGKPFAREYFGDGRPVAIVETCSQVVDGKVQVFWTTRLAGGALRCAFSPETFEAIAAVIRSLPDAPKPNEVPW